MSATVRLNRAGSVKQFVTVPESGLERRPNLWNGKLGMHRGGIGRRDMPTLLGDVLLFSVFAVWVVGNVIAIYNALS